MKKIWTIIPALLLVAACSDDENGYTAPPALSDEDAEINIPAIPADWAPGMAYKPYSDELPAAPGVAVNVLLVGEGEKGEQALAVAENNAWIWSWVTYGSNVQLKDYVKPCYFPNHSDVHVSLTGSETEFNPEGKPCDIVVLGNYTEKLAEAQYYMLQLEEIFGDDYPLVVVAGGNNNNTFSTEAWDLCIRRGGLDWEEDVLPAFPEWEVGEVLTDEQKVYYHPGNVFAAYALKNVDGFGRAANWIVVGDVTASVNKPGTVLQERWISAPITFNIGDAYVSSSMLGAAYVAKIAAEVKRRLPELTNAEVADLILSTADPKDAETYGRGVIDPRALWEKVAELESDVNDGSNN